MEKNIYYPIDYGWYDSKDKWTDFCSSDCQIFSECANKGGFCSSNERRILHKQHKPITQEMLYENNEVYGAISLGSGGERRSTPLFWHFPGHEGLYQPWRHKLWNLKK